MTPLGNGQSGTPRTFYSTFGSIVVSKYCYNKQFATISDYHCTLTRPRSGQGDEDEREKQKCNFFVSPANDGHARVRGRRRQEIFLMIGEGRQIASFGTAEKVLSLAWKGAIISHREGLERGRRGCSFDIPDLRSNVPIRNQALLPCNLSSPQSMDAASHCISLCRVEIPRIAPFRAFCKNLPTLAGWADHSFRIRHKSRVAKLGNRA